jgi:hypothetical protein
MPRKKDGMLFEVHPTPVKGKDGRNIVYVRPAGKLKISMKGLEDFCSRSYRSRYGELSMAFDYFLRAAGELMAQGYRIDTPIGSFAPRLKLMREITDPDEVTGRDVMFDGIDYNPGKRWKEELQKWSRGFRRMDNPNTQEIMADKPKLEALIQKLVGNGGCVTVRYFAWASKLTYYSARKLLNEWCEGDNPKLLKTKRGQEYIYTAL